MYKFNGFMKYILHCLASILKKFHLNIIVYKALSPFFHRTLIVSEDMAREARDFLESISEKTNNSSVCHNLISENPEYDLLIIVPAYNVERYIEECINSILSQKTKYKYKIVIVDDGSTDRTGVLLDQYQADMRIKIIHQSNKGFSGARNIALKEVNARYISFVDSDDYLCENAIENLLMEAYQSNSDIVEGSFKSFQDDSVLSECLHEDESGVEYMLGKLRGFAWGKVFKSTLFRCIQFPEGYWFEDTINVFLLFPMCSKISTISSAVYCYRRNLQGITSQSRKRVKSIDSYWIVEQMLSDMKLLQLNKTQSIYEQTLRQIKLTYNRTFFLDSQISKAIFILTVDLLHREFNGYHSLESRWKSYENSLMKHEYGIYKLYGLLG